MVSYVKKEGSLYWPSKEMKNISVIDESVYEQAEKDPVKFWEKLAKNLSWFKPWKKAYEEKLPFYKWFVGGKLNLSYNCLDRHLTEKSEKTALLWVPEDPTQKKMEISYKELYSKVNKLANLLKKQGVKKGDVVAIYLPLIPNVVISMLACSRIGAIHLVVFSAFSAEALKARIQDGGANILITCDGYLRKGKPELLKPKVEEGIKGTSVKKIILIQKLSKIKLSGCYLDWDEIEKESEECPPEEMDSEDPLFILYTSGTTGKPKGIVHVTGGYAVQAMHTAKFIFNLNEKEVMWCTADIGWITGHTYMCYGPLLNGITTLMFEGSLDYPDFSRPWKIIEENKVSVFYTAPTAIRMLKAYGEQFVDKFKLESLKILGSVGEPIDNPTWQWFFEKVGKKRCPIVDTYWQTETGGILVSSLAAIGPFIPSFAARPFPGVRINILDDNGKEVKKGQTANLVFLPPLSPGALRSIWKDPEKYAEKYWPLKKFYLTGDGAYIENGYLRITGRVDDIIKVAGHRLSTAEMEDAIHHVAGISENAVVSKPDYIRGELPVVFVKLKSNVSPSDALKEEIIKSIIKKIGPIAKPSDIYFVEDLPKTRSGKTMRRILKALLRNEPLGELSTIINPDCIEKIKKAIPLNKS